MYRLTLMKRIRWTIVISGINRPRLDTSLMAELSIRLYLETPHSMPSGQLLSQVKRIPKELILRHTISLY